jgi:hypothetical protein
VAADCRPIASPTIRALDPKLWWTCSDSAAIGMQTARNLKKKDGGNGRRPAQAEPGEVIAKP